MPVFDRDHGRTMFCPALRELICQLYGIDDFSSISYLPSGHQNKSYCVKDKIGARFLVRFYVGKNDKQILQEHELLADFAGTELSSNIIPPLLNNEDSTLTRFGKTQIALFPYIQHQKITVSTATCFLLNFVPRMHTRMRPVARRYKERTIETNAQLIEALSRFYAKNKSISSDYSYIKELLSRTTCEPPVTSETIIHYDLHRGNVIHNGGIHYLIDFDDFIVGASVFDFASLCRGFCFDRTTCAFLLEEFCRLWTHKSSFLGPVYQLEVLEMRWYIARDLLHAMALLAPTWTQPGRSYHKYIYRIKSLLELKDSDILASTKSPSGKS